MIESVLIVGIVIACAAWYVQHKWRKRVRTLAAARDSTGLELLARRYARGEKRGDMLGYHAVSPSRL